MAKKTTTPAEKPSIKQDYKAMKPADILKKVTDLKEESATLKRNMRIGDVQNVKAYIFKRRELARALTALNQVREEK